MVARSVTLALRCGDCCRLYAYLDQRQGSNRSWAVRGAGEVASAMTWQLRTAKKHLRHLADVGLITLDPEPGRAWANTLVAVAHQPARDRYAKVRSVPGVWEPEPDARWKKPPKTAEEVERLRANGWRDAPPVDDEQKAQRARTGGASRSLESPNGWRDALPVPGSNDGSEVESSVHLLETEQESTASASNFDPFVEVCAGGNCDQVGTAFSSDRWWCQACEPFEAAPSIEAPATPVPDPEHEALLDAWPAGPCRRCGQRTGLEDFRGGWLCSRCLPVVVDLDDADLDDADLDDADAAVARLLAAFPGSTVVTEETAA